MDLGTGYYLAMIHDIQGRYETLKFAFKVKVDGTMEKPTQQVKFWSDVYFNPKFDLQQVP